jgi:uncharacterized protein YcgI (DUF1989 family)
VAVSILARGRKRSGGHRRSDSGEGWFQNTQYVAGKGIQYLPTVSKPGQYVVFLAEMDAVVVFSACPQDMLPVNSGTPTEAHVELL